MSLRNLREGPAPVLSVANLTVTRRGPRGSRVTVLDDVSLSLSPGECLAIVGASGSGKSVLARTLIGLTDPSAGANLGGTAWQVRARQLEIAGHDMRLASQRAWRTLRGPVISLVLQDALQSLDPLRTIENEVGEALAVRQKGSLRSLRSARRTAVIEALHGAGLPDPESLLPLRADMLSGGMRQRALIASATIAVPRVLVADEPTTALDPATARDVLDEFARLRDSGTSLVVVSHDLSAVARVADRIAVITDGRIVETGSTQSLLNQPDHPATRALVDAIPRRSTGFSAGLGTGQDEKPRPARPEPAHPEPARSGPAHTEPGHPEPRHVEPRHVEPLRVEPLRHGGAIGASSVVETLATLESATRTFGTRAGKFLGIKNIDLTISRGEVLGIAGGSGEGKTTLARVIAGAEHLDSGTLTLAPNARVRLIPQDPLATFDPRWRVRKILEATLSRSPFAPNEAPSPADLMRRVGLSPDLLSRKPATLSGGERQRVAIARALAAKPDILVADEAVSALDTVTQAGILTLLRSLRNELGIVFVSHDLTMLSSISDRIVVIQGGRIADAIHTEAFLSSALGLGSLRTD